MPHPSDDDWQAIAGRQPRAGVYAVVTTGVLCRFGCPARRPLRGNVRVFDTGAAAVAAGFRPCRLCRPDVGNMQESAGRDG